MTSSEEQAGSDDPVESRKDMALTAAMMALVDVAQNAKSSSDRVAAADKLLEVYGKLRPARSQETPPGTNILAFLGAPQGKALLEGVAQTLSLAAKETPVLKEPS
jgi:hypothetical protein